ncbi:uncharacterized protein N7458_008791 [Penicillium daleae]|uniref:Uncharacterized protein n=1 Tax=Penicillium daleae TaxID=63821 RepID=A0AAD6BVE5_9EURO|nr:uncharacterized protein N7458_008791 [Penicillium daleae]KAJ5437793.1 hypothetical protein N7458_008791 [Penicillium daleae]
MDDSLLQAKTSIPIPKILDWSDDAANSIGSEYIIIDHAADAIYRKLRETAEINFPAYGSLYFVITLFEPSSRLPLDGDFCIGPHCGTRYWSYGDHRYYQHTVPNQGLSSLMQEFQGFRLGNLNFQIDHPIMDQYRHI